VNRNRNSLIEEWEGIGGPVISSRKVVVKFPVVFAVIMCLSIHPSQVG